MIQSLAGRAHSIREAALDRAIWTTLHALPYLPDGLKRLLGGRRVTVDGNTLDTTLQVALAGERIVGLDGLVASPEVAVARVRLRATSAALPGRISADVTSLTIPGPAGPIPVRHYRSPAAAAPLLVYYHGGGMVIGDLDTHDQLCRRICRDGDLHVVSVDYRLAPEHKAPASVEDADAAYRWALEHAAEFGADPARIAVGGDSAGGTLAAVVTQRARDEGTRLPVLQLLIYPVTDWSGDTRSTTLFAEGFYLTKRHLDWFTGHYLSGAPVGATDPVVSPLLAEDLSGLAPALVLTAGFDPLRDEGNAYAEAMRSAGVTADLREFGSLIHGFANFFSLGGGSEAAMAEMISALRARLGCG